MMGSSNLHAWHAACTLICETHRAEPGAAHTRTHDVDLHVFWHPQKCCGSKETIFFLTTRWDPSPPHPCSPTMQSSFRGWLAATAFRLCSACGSPTHLNPAASGTLRDRPKAVKTAEQHEHVRTCEENHVGSSHWGATASHNRNETLLFPKPLSLLPSAA
eukprot:2487229-Rhodomonas_salina.8